MQQSRLISFALVAPALLILLALFVYPLGFLAGERVRRRERRLDLRQFLQGVRVLLARHPVHRGDRRAVDLADRHLLDRDRRLSGAGRASARGRRAALAVSLAAVHPVHRRRPGDAHLPRQERHDEQHPGRARPARADRTRRAFWTGAASSSPSSGSRRRSWRSWSRAPWPRSTLRRSRPREISAPGACACCSRSSCRRSARPWPSASSCPS